MNYHLMIDDKFIDKFIEDAEIASPHNNLYIFTFTPPGYYVKSEKGIFAAYRSEALNKILENITEHDRLYVHWFRDEMIDYITKINLKTPIYLFFWGGDFLEQTTEFVEFNLDALTKKYVQRNDKLKVFHWTKHPFNYLIQIRNYLSFEDRTRIELAKKKDIRKTFLKRLNFFCHWNYSEFEKIKQAYNCNPEYLNFFYDPELQKISKPVDLSKTKDKCLTIWVGNSASRTNNHLDALHVLKKFKDNKIMMILPLSYGQKKYGDFISKQGKKIYREKLNILKNFLPLDDYFKLLEKVNVVVMYHNRAQATGNIFAFIKMGKKVYLKKQSSIYELMCKSNIKVFDANTIKDLSFEEFSKPLSEDDIYSNAKKISDMFSEKRKLTYLSNILN